MNKLANTLLLALMLLLSQTAVALHDIHCLDEDHAPSCQVCAAHDHSACSSEFLVKLEETGYEQKPVNSLSSISNSSYVSCYLSRAPPQSL